MVLGETFSVAAARVFHARVDTQTIEAVAQFVGRAIFVVLTYWFRVLNWQTTNISVALEPFRTAAVRAVIGVDTDCIVRARVVDVAGSLARAADARFSQWAIFIAGAAQWLVPEAVYGGIALETHGACAHWSVRLGSAAGGRGTATREGTRILAHVCVARLHIETIVIRLAGRLRLGAAGRWRFLAGLAGIRSFAGAGDRGLGHFKGRGFCHVYIDCGSVRY